MSRRLIRSEAMKYLYARSFNKTFSVGEFLLYLTKIKKTTEKQDLESLIRGILQTEEAIEELTKECSTDYDNISILDKCIIKVGAFELLYSDLAKNIVINESVEIAKEFSDEISKSLVNAILECIGATYERQVDCST